MSSMRNAVHRRNHKERAQPLERRRLGLLEKHKDYSLRAKDFNKKKATTKRLKQLAAERNEDEFYFKMLSGRRGPGSLLSRGKSWTGTVDGDRGNRALDMDTVRLLKTQDMGYLRTVRNHTAKEVRELEERAILARAFHGDGGGDGGGDDNAEEPGSRPRPQQNKPQRIVFVDAEDAESPSFEGFKDRDERGSQPAKDRRKAKKVAVRLRRELLSAKKKLKALGAAEYSLEVQRARMAKTATVGGVTKQGKMIKIRRRKR